MKRIISFLLLLAHSVAFAQTPDTLTPEKKARWLFGRIRDNTVRAITPADFRNAFNAVANMAARRVPYLTMKEVRDGKADTAQVIQVINNAKVYTYRYDASSTDADDSATVIRNGNRRYLINVDVVTPQLFGAKADGVTNDGPAIQKAINYLQRRSAKGGKVFFPFGNYKVSSTVYVRATAANPNTPVPIQLEGEHGTFESHYGLGSRLIAGTPLMFAVNLKPDGNAGMSDPLRTYTGFGASNLTFSNPDSIANAEVFRIFRTRFEFEKLTQDGFYSLINCIQQDASGNQTYCDYSVIRKIRSRDLRGNLIRLWFADASVVESVYAERCQVGVNTVIWASSSGAITLRDISCSAPRTGTTPVVNSAIIKMADCRFSLDGFYVEHQEQFAAAMSIASCKIANISTVEEKYNGLTFFKTYDSNLDVKGFRTWSVRMAGNVDIDAIGTASTLSNVKLSTITAKTYAGGGDAATAADRRLSVRDATSALGKYTDDDKFLYLYSDGTALKLTNEKGQDMTLKYGQPVITGDQISLPATLPHNELTLPNLINYRGVNIDRVYMTSRGNFAYKPELISRAYGDQVAIRAFDNEFNFNPVFTDVQNATTTETVLATNSIPAKFLGFAADHIQAEFYVRLTPAGGTLNLKFGSTTFYTTGAITPAATTVVKIVARFFRTSATTYNYVVDVTGSGTAADGRFVLGGSGVDFTVANNFQITGQGANTGDITLKTSLMKYIPGGYAYRRVGLLTSDDRINFQIKMD